MATPKKKPSKGLIWNINPDGGEYARFNGCIIFRYKGSYSYRTAYNKYYNAESLAEAKKKIDQYNNARMKELQIKKKNHQIKKR